VLDRQERGEDQDRVRARIAGKPAGCPAENGRVERDAHPLLSVRCESGVAERDAGAQIESDGDGGNRLVWLMESGMVLADGGPGD